MINKNLQNMLAMMPDDCEVWCSAHNGYVDTYAVVDRIIPMNYDAVSNDFFGTPGRMDKRLFEGRRKSPDKKNDIIIFIDSDFGHIPNKEVDIGDDNINYPIKTINGEDGNPDYVWEANEFERCSEIGWVKYFTPGDKENDGSRVYYDTESECLFIINKQDDIEFKGKVTGIEDLRNICDACKVPFRIWC